MQAPILLPELGAAPAVLSVWFAEPGETVFEGDRLVEGATIEVFGVDISRYALMNCEKEVVGRLHLGNAVSLPFPDGSFDCVISLNTIQAFPQFVLQFKAE